MTDKHDYWRIYFDAATVARADALRETAALTSAGVRLHIDRYAQADAAAPVIIFNHGGGGYSRLFTGLALALHARGYSVLLPDQIGQGLSGGSWRDLTIGAFVRNIVDVATWVRQTHTGPVFLAGGSLGGGLAYHAAAAGAPVDGVICHNLYEFGRAHDALAVSRFAPLANVPGVPGLVGALIRGAGRLLPGLPLPYRLLGHFDRMVDRRERAFYPRWLADPVPLRRVTLGYLASMFSTPPAVALADNRRPVLVINPTRDEMVSPDVTRHNFERLGGPTSYAELPYGHWALGSDFVAAWVAIVDDWCRAVAGRR